MNKRQARQWRAATWVGMLSSGAALPRAVPMPRRRLSPPWRWRRRGWAIAGSALLHLLALAAILLLPGRLPVVPNIAEPGTVDVLMLPAGAPHAVPKAVVPAPPLTVKQPPRQEASAAPVPQASPVPKAPAIPPQPPLALAGKAQEPPRALHAGPTPSVAAASTPAAKLEATKVVPPPPPVPAKAPPQSQPAGSRAAAAMHPAFRSLAQLDAALGVAPHTPPRATAPPHRGVDLRLGPQARTSNGALPVNPRSAEGMVRIVGADLGAEWVKQLHAWWREHSSYPPWAAAAGQDGTNMVKLLVDRSGKVLNAELKISSGSKWLDIGTMATFRDAHLPPFPPSTPQNQATLYLTISYILIRGG